MYSAPTSIDRRGVSRIFSGNPDIGAFEKNINFNQLTLSNGYAGTNYNQVLTITRQSRFAEITGADLQTQNSVTPFIFSIVPIAGQNLPPGLSPASDGTLSGTPTQAGSYTFTVKAIDTADGIAGAQPYTVQILAPTAASVSVAGRVLTSEGRGLVNATVVMTDAFGNTRTARTSTFGYYRFDEVAVGQTYIFSIVSKHYQFTPQIINIIEELTELNFSAQ